MKTIVQGERSLGLALHLPPPVQPRCPYLLAWAQRIPDSNGQTVNWKQEHQYIIQFIWIMIDSVD